MSRDVKGNQTVVAGNRMNNVVKSNGNTGYVERQIESQAEARGWLAQNMTE